MKDGGRNKTNDERRLDGKKILNDLFGGPSSDDSSSSDEPLLMEVLFATSTEVVVSESRYM